MHHPELQRSVADVGKTKRSASFVIFNRCHPKNLADSKLFAIHYNNGSPIFSIGESFDFAGKWSKPLDGFYQ
jgi:hypothetical protein